MLKMKVSRIKSYLLYNLIKDERNDDSELDSPALIDEETDAENDDNSNLTNLGTVKCVLKFSGHFLLFFRRRLN